MRRAVACVRPLRTQRYCGVLIPARCLTAKKEEEGAHAAQHQLTHRFKEKAGIKAAERVVERLVERSERLIESSVERVAERAAERVGERAAERIGERAAERAAERIGERAAERVAERAAERVGERAAERVAERAAERVAERAAERVGERAGERITEHIAERTGERITERLAERAGERAALRATERVAGHVGDTANLVRRATQARMPLGRLPVTIGLVGRRALIALPVVGGLFATYMCYEDAKRCRDELVAGNRTAAGLFGVAATADAVDAVAHFVTAYGLAAEWSHHAIAGPEQLSLGAAAVSIAAAISGEFAAAAKDQPLHNKRSS